MSRWNDLILRVLSALVLLPIALLCVLAGGYAFLLLVGIACILAADEWATLCGYPRVDRRGSEPGGVWISRFWWHRVRTPRLWMPAAIAAAAVCSGLGAAGTGLLVLSIAAFAASIWIVRSQPSSGSGPVEPGKTQTPDPGTHASIGPATGSRAAVFRSTPRSLSRFRGGGRTAPGPGGAVVDCRGDAKTGPAGARLRYARIGFLFGFPYLGLPAVALPWLRIDPAAGLANTLFLLSIVWGSDIGAYAAGRLIGGPKLAPTISPGKTWSGAAGGLIAAALAGLSIAACFSSGFSPSHVVGVAIALGIASQAGDLVESALKRHFGVKDSGRIIPGHGGMLDRLDALLVAAPLAAVLASSVGRGVVLWR